LNVYEFTHQLTSIAFVLPECLIGLSPSSAPKPNESHGF